MKMARKEDILEKEYQRKDISSNFKKKFQNTLFYFQNYFSQENTCLNN